MVGRWYLAAMIIITGIGNAIILVMGDENREQYFSLIKENWEIVAVFPALLTSIGTIVIAMLMHRQNLQQRKEHDLKLRPVIISAERLPGTLFNFPFDSVAITITNVGNVPASNIRIMTLPSDTYNEFRVRKEALKDYLREIGTDDIKSTKSCIVMHPPSERIKHAHDPSSPVKYLILGNDFKKVNPKIERFNKMMDEIQDKNIREKFEMASKARTRSLASLQYDKWNEFYKVGLKSGDLIDKIGPIDWEVFYEQDWNETRKILTNYANMKSSGVRKYVDEVCNTKNARDKIINDMTEDMKKGYYEAADKLQEIWNKLPKNVVSEYIENNMELRKAYKETRDVKSILMSILAPNDSIKLAVDINSKGFDHIHSGKYIYFGVLIQYSQLQDNDMKYAYYVQGYVDYDTAYVDYTDVIHI